VKTEADVFSELYQLWLTVKEFPCQNRVFKNARLLLHRPDTDRLWQAWRKAQARGRAERVTVRYDLPRDHPLPVAIAHAMAQARLLKGRHMGGGQHRLPSRTTR
jgi:hypothetical protein